MENRTRTDRSMRIAGLYALLAGLWIAGSDQFLAILTLDPNTLTQIQTYKGWFFVAVTTLLLYLILRQDERSRDRAEDSVRVSEEAFRALAENNPSIVLRYNKDLQILFMNTAGVKIHHLAPSQVMGRTARAIMGDSPLVRFWEERVREVFSTGSSETTQFEFNGRVYDWRLAPEFDSRGEVVSAIAVSTDITDRVQAERDLSEANQRILGLAEQTMSTKEKERQRLAQTLDEQIGQTLNNLRHSLEEAGVETPEEMPALRQQVESALDWVDIAMTRIQEVSHELSPPGLEKHGLNRSLEVLCDVFSRRTQLEVNFRGTEIQGLSEAANATFYRLLREALNNITEHSHATLVDVELGETDGDVWLAVAHNGSAADQPVKEAPQRYENRVKRMREQVELLGGSLKMEINPEQGSRLVATIPGGRKPSA